MPAVASSSQKKIQLYYRASISTLTNDNSKQCKKAVEFAPPPAARSPMFTGLLNCGRPGEQSCSCDVTSSKGDDSL